MRVSKENELNKLLPKALRDEYAIGIHGFDTKFWKEKEDGSYEPDIEGIREAKKGILGNGLKIAGDRKLLSTVRFYDLNGYIQTKGFYELGGIIVALPKNLVSESGKEMFIGSPNEFNPYTNRPWDRNREATSLSEVVLVEDGNVLPPQFILGTYSKDENGIDVELNDKHMAFGKQIVSDEYLDRLEKKIGPLLRSGVIGVPVIKETQEQRVRYNKTHQKGLFEKISKMRGRHEGKKEVTSIFASWINKTKEREESKEDGVK